MTDQNDTTLAVPGDKPIEPLWRRAIFTLIIGAMISIAQMILFLIAVVQFIVLLIDNRKPNDRIAEFGVMVGDLVALAARYQSVATEARPWPFREPD